ncbi:MAG: RNA methyltransferase [Prevotella sp.]|nr:RNA methyltransferase [Bacteroides sp.]MCM1366036.1 RNA methyltransferase [Prevotella sp.]MCM1436894.1 RNA methyltransferase [Prevotella sp.]
MKILEITDIRTPEVAIFGALTQRNLRRECPDIFIAESPKVIQRALDAGCRPLSLLCEQRHIEGDAASIIASMPDIPIYTGSREVLCELTGYALTRGVLCAMRRYELPKIEDICRKSRRLVIIDQVCDTTNVGAIFRCAAALGMDAVMVTRASCDPLNRRAIRVSMGTVFQIPWCWIENVADVKKYGFKTVALALRNNSISLEDPQLTAHEKLALVMGTEGEGLSNQTIADCDYTVTIPMSHGVDSLNVAAAAAIACYALAKG